MNTPSHLDPSLPLAVVRQIDQICDRFEESLQAGDRPPIEVLLESVEDSQRGPLLQALVEIELEYRRVWGERPTADEYVDRYPLYGEAVRAAFESEAVDHLYGADADRCLLQMILSRASGRRADRLRVYYRGELVHTTLLSGPLELGRQKQGEPAPFAVTPGRYGDRLVVAPLPETSVSRRHAFLEPEGEDRVRVTNLSNVNPIVLANERRLQTDESQVFPLTLEMALGAVFIRIDRPSPDGESSDNHTVPVSQDAASDSGSAPPGFFKRLWGRDR